MSKSATSIEIRDLYKIFGTDPAKYVEAVRNGMSKTELGDVHGHILGLNNINISQDSYYYYYSGYYYDYYSKGEYQESKSDREGEAAKAKTKAERPAEAGLKPKY